MFDLEGERWYNGDMEEEKHHHCMSNEEIEEQRRILKTIKGRISKADYYSRLNILSALKTVNDLLNPPSND
jgi:hypothetical protein